MLRITQEQRQRTQAKVTSDFSLIPPSRTYGSSLRTAQTSTTARTPSHSARLALLLYVTNIDMLK